MPWGPLTRRMLPVTIVYFCYGWTLWLYLNWLPSFFLQRVPAGHPEVGALLVGGLLRRRRSATIVGGEVSDRILQRTGDVQKARRNVVMAGFLGSFVCLLPIFLTQDLTVIIARLGAAFFCRGARDRADVVDPDGHRAASTRGRRAA